MAYKNLHGTTEDSFKIGKNGPLLQRIAGTSRLRFADLLRWLPSGTASEGHLFSDSSGDMSVKKSNLSATIDPTGSNDNTQGYSIGSMWVNTTNNSSFICTNTTTSNAIWRLIGASDTEVAVKTGFDQSFFTSSSPYIDTAATSSSPYIVSYYLFPGSNVNSATQFRVVGSRAGTSGTSSADIFDVTNNQVLSTINWTSNSIAKFPASATSNISNLPTGEAVFAIRIYTNGSRTRLHYASIR